MTSLTQAELQDLKRFMEMLAAESGEIICRYFKQAIGVDIKTDNTPVTIADRLAEEKIRALIEKEFPSHGIIGEEFGRKNDKAKYTWVLDPIDGTKSFLSGSFDFGTLVALLEDGKPVLGMINQPVLKELMIGDNSRTTLNGGEVKVRDCKDLSEAILVTWDLFAVGEYQDPQGFKQLLGKIKCARTWGNCYGYALLASGFVDISVDPIMAPWDIMALIPVIKGAGGVISDYKGNDPASAKSIVAASKGIHTKVIEILNHPSGGDLSQM